MTYLPHYVLFYRYWIALVFCSCTSLLLIGQVERPIGTNLTSVQDYSTELVFTDAFKQARTWISFNADGSGPWSTDVPVPLDAQGYPVEIPYDDGINAPQALRTLLLWDIGEAAPVGMYRLRATGNGTIRLRFGVNTTLQCPIDTLLYAEGQVALEILTSDAANPVRDIRFVYPDYTERFDEQTFTDEFLSFVEDFQVVRFMDWLHTNGSETVTWSDRTQEDNYTQSMPAGVAWEYVLELCNELQKDAWINIPHLADDAYIEALAEFLLAGLDSNLSIYLEYSNEVWNGQFSQNHDAAELATALGYTGDPWVLTWKYTAKRSADIFRIFESVFPNDDRLIKIIPAQAANSWLSNQLITFFQDPIYNPTQVAADALAIAPYFAGRVANDIVDEGLTATITVAEIIARMDASLEESYGWMSANQDVADQHGLRLITYEGGQHLVGTGANVNNDILTEKLVATNRAAAMQDLYCQYFDHWYENQGDLFVHFSSHYRANRYGSWGVKENMQDIESPKYMGLQQCVFSYNEEPNALRHITDEHFVQVYPNPLSGDQVHIDLSEQAPILNAVKLINVHGITIIEREMVSPRQSFTWDISTLSSGVYVILFMDNRGVVSTRKVIIP